MRHGLAVVVLTLACIARADEAVRLQESFRPDYQYRVNTRVELAGKLSLSTDKAKPAKPLPVVGTSALDYDERVLTVADGSVTKTVRIFRRIDFERKVGDQLQKTTLRPTVRRLVLLRKQTSEVPFCPEGPLLWNEIDLVRTDVFTPALTGLLPDREVKPGDRWSAAASAVQELTDLEKIEDGRLECRFEGVAVLERRRHARVSLAGTVKGVNEDGPNRQQLDGYFYFDLESNHLSYLSLHGVHSMLDRDGNESGRVEGTFVLTRQVHVSARELSDDGLRGVSLEPTADNTLLLYDNEELGVRFLYPRRWRVAGGLGLRIRLDATSDAGLLITLEPPARMPSTAQFQVESKQYFHEQKAKVLRADAPQRMQGSPRELDHFTLDVDLNGPRVEMAYYLARQANGGAILAARLPTEDRVALSREAAFIARSLVITKPLK